MSSAVCVPLAVFDTVAPCASDEVPLYSCGHPVLMVIHELTASQCREQLARKNLGRLACAQANQPYVTPFFFYFDAAADCLYSFSMVGQKIEWMRANPKVCVEIDDIVDKFHWTSVIVLGRYEELGNSTSDRDARTRALEQFQKRPSWWFPAAAKMTSSDEHTTPVVFRIRLDTVTVRRAARPVE
jgi:nitroimidazol reductase NimA-like FMN-containing flavoprotein (pyridoxamine 5'-phosphate oxidase superfamily)